MLSDMNQLFVTVTHPAIHFLGIRPAVQSETTASSLSGRTGRNNFVRLMQPLRLATAVSDCTAGRTASKCTKGVTCDFPTGKVDRPTNNQQTDCAVARRPASRPTHNRLVLEGLPLPLPCNAEAIERTVEGHRAVDDRMMGGWYGTTLGPRQEMQRLATSLTSMTQYRTCLIPAPPGMAMATCEVPAPPGMAVATLVCFPDLRSRRIMVVVAPSLLFSVTLRAVWLRHGVVRPGTSRLGAKRAECWCWCWSPACSSRSPCAWDVVAC